MGCISDDDHKKKKKNNKENRQSGLAPVGLIHGTRSNKTGGEGIVNMNAYRD